MTTPAADLSTKKRFRKRNRVAVATSDPDVPWNSFTRIKFCRFCKCYHPITQFPKSKNSMDGLATSCSLSKRGPNRTYYRRNRDTILNNALDTRLDNVACLRDRRKADYIIKKNQPIIDRELARQAEHKRLYPDCPYYSGELAFAQLAVKRARKLRRRAGSVNARGPGRPRKTPEPVQPLNQLPPWASTRRMSRKTREQLKGTSNATSDTTPAHPGPAGTAADL